MFERGDLLLVPYPFTDLSTAKRRPVLALTKPDAYGDSSPFRSRHVPRRSTVLLLLRVVSSAANCLRRVGYESIVS
jgi:hypothetical protein